MTHREPVPMADCADLLDDLDRWLEAAVAGLPIGSCPRPDCTGGMRPLTDTDDDGNTILAAYSAGASLAHPAACDKCGHEEVVLGEGRTAAYARERRLRAQGVTTHRQAALQPTNPIGSDQ